jgi:D-alanyl-D-alanine carboxypeptidase
MRKFPPALIITLLIFLSVKNFAQSFSPQIVAKLQSKLDSMQAAQGIQGVAASVYLPNQGFWKGRSGLSQPGVPISPDMKFGIGSNSKLFASVALLKLQERGLLSLDDSVGSWLPPIPNVASEITIRQLLNHTSGVFDITEIEGYPDTVLADPNRVFQMDEVMQWVQTPLFPPGMDWSYSNTNYLLAGLIFEQASNVEIEKFIRESLLIPNGLDNTYFPIFDALPTDVARPYLNNLSIANIPRTSILSIAWTAGAMYSNAEDMNRWYQKLLGGEILSAASRSQLLAFTGTAEYGLGIQKVDLGGRTCYAHGGSIRGYRSFVLLDEATGAVIAVLCNEMPASAQLVAEALLLAIAEAFTGVSNVDPPDLSNVEIFPNPIWGGRFSWIINDPKMGDLLKVSIFDQNGQLLFQKENPGGNLDVSDLAAGVYFLNIRLEKGEIWKKIIR